MTNDSNDYRGKRKITKKGILITALIVAGIIGASFLIYLIP
jgi:hypothetical protein